MSDARGSRDEQELQRVDPLEVCGVAPEKIDWVRNATPFDIMRDEWARQQPLIVGRRFDHYVHSLDGYRSALRQHGLRHEDAMDGFEDWMRLHVGDDNVNVLGWWGFIIEEYGNETPAFDRFFQLFEMFERDLGNSGLDAILNELKQRDIDRYGFSIGRRWE